MAKEGWLAHISSKLIHSEQLQNAWGLINLLQVLLTSQTSISFNHYSDYCETISERLNMYLFSGK